MAEESHADTKGAVKINRAYLEGLSAELDQLRTEIRTTVLVAGKSDNADSSGLLPIVDGTLAVRYGAPKFAAGETMNKQLGAMAASVKMNLDWLADDVLAVMVKNIRNTLEKFTKTEELNAEDARALAVNIDGLSSPQSLPPAVQYVPAPAPAKAGQQPPKPGT